MTDSIQLSKCKGKWAFTSNIYNNIRKAYKYFNDYQNSEVYNNGMNLAMNHIHWSIQRYRKNVKRHRTRHNIDRLIYDFYYSHYNNVETLTNAFYLYLNNITNKKHIEKFYAYGIKCVNHHISKGITAHIDLDDEICNNAVKDMDKYTSSSEEENSSEEDD
jgi:hypothetical protein